MHFVSEQDYRTRKQVEADYPGATKIRKVCRGWMVFDFATDYEIWKGQK
jgi:hypothetical protein